MTGTIQSGFEDFDLLTGPLEASAIRQMVNAATIAGGRLIARMMMGSGGFYRSFKGGASIQDHIYLDRVRVRRKVHGNERTRFVNPQLVKLWSIPWREEWTHWSVADRELVLQGSSGFGDGFQTFKDVKHAKIMNCVTDWVESHEEDLWAQPDFSGMEGQDGKESLCIPALVNEYTNGLYTGATDVTANWTTKQGLDPVANPNWDNQRSAATAAGGDAYLLASGGGDAWTYWAAFEDLYEDLDFQALPKFPEYSSPTKSAKIIACSKYGINMVRTALRKSNDRLAVAGQQDAAYSSPMFHGIPFVRCGALDGANLFADGSTGLTDEEATVSGGTKGPRYWFLNLEHLKKAWHRDRFWFRRKVRPTDQIWSSATAYNTYHNLYADNLRCHGIAYPAGDVAALA